VVWTGHPLLVFAPNRPGDHPQGRAFDSYRIDGQLVVDPAKPWSLVAGFMRRPRLGRTTLAAGTCWAAPRSTSGTRRTTTAYTPASRRERVGAFSGRRGRRPFSFRAYRRGVSPPFRTFNWELRSCGLRGHATYAPTERALAERVQAHTAAGTAWRCLRCGAYVPGGPRGFGPADEAPQVRRGRAVRDAFILRLLVVCLQNR